MKNFRIEDAIKAKENFSGFKNKPFRRYQGETILHAINGEKKFSIVEAPTGSGKSLIGMVSGAMEGGCTYLVHSKVLQQQLVADFPEAFVLFGRNNYPCLLWEKEGLDCSMCTHNQSTPCPYASAKGRKARCLYEAAKHQALASQFRVLNYDYFITEANFVGRFSGEDFIVCDEADAFEDILVDFVSLSFSYKLLADTGINVGPFRKTAKSQLGIEPWVLFAQEVKDHANKYRWVLEAQAKRLQAGRELAFLMRKIQRVQTLVTKAKIFLDNVDDTWLFDDRDENNVTFRPIWMTEKLAEQFMWRHGKRFLVLSAVFPPNTVLSATLGIPGEDIDKLRVPSTFPVGNRNIYLENTAKLTSKTFNEEVPKIVSKVDEIMEKHPNEKGLIHCVSYKLGEAIAKGCKKGNRLVVHNGNNRQEQVSRFRESDKPLVMISPSLDRGVSLNDDLCRFIIIAKAPYLSLGDKVTSARLYSSRLGQLWYTTNMLLTVLQMSGRGMRSETDRCNTYILDQLVDKAICEMPSVLPDWWKEAIIE